MANSFNALLKPSEALARIVGSENISRPQVTAKVWEYIKGKNPSGKQLQDPNDGRIIVCDEALQAVIGEPRINMMKLAGAFKAHLTPVGS